MTPVLHTEQLTFRPYRPEDEDHFVELLRDEEVCRWMGQDRVPEAELRTLLRAILSDVSALAPPYWGWLCSRNSALAQLP